MPRNKTEKVQTISSPKSIVGVFVQWALESDKGFKSTLDRRMNFEWEKCAQEDEALRFPSCLNILSEAYSIVS